MRWPYVATCLDQFLFPLHIVAYFARFDINLLYFTFHLGQGLQRPRLPDLDQGLLALFLWPLAAVRQGGRVGIHCRIGLDDFRERRHYRVSQPAPRPPHLPDLFLRYRVDMSKGARLKFLQAAHRRIYVELAVGLGHRRLVIVGRQHHLRVMLVPRVCGLLLVPALVG